MASALGSPVAAAEPRPLWWDTGSELAARPPLPGPGETDVAIVGAGFSGLWTANHLLDLDPSRRITIVERHHVGFGASGRNGGWAVGELAGAHGAYAARSDEQRALALDTAIARAVHQVGDTAARLGIDCGFVHGGNIRVARTAPQWARQRAEVDAARSIGHGPDVIRLLDADESRRHLEATDVHGGIWFAPCAALDPFALVTGLARSLETRGVTIHEGTTVRSIEPGRVLTDHGELRATTVIRATEAYSRDLRGARRDLLPVYSYMIATEPIPADRWTDIGLDGRPTFADDRTMVIYGQRTADDRLAFGATGTPYRFGSVIDRRTEFDLGSAEHVHGILRDLLPQVADVAITHRWGGVLGIPRNWLPSVHFDPASGIGVLGGYVGEGVAAAHLAGQTLAELVVGVESERTELPWVGARSRRWEPEPLRWLGVRGSRALLGAADRREARTGRDARVATWVAGLVRGD